MTRDKMLSTLITVRRLLVEVAHQVDTASTGSDPSIDYWERAYGAVFDSGPLSLIARIREELTELGLRFPDYYDPDTSYEEDVRAYAEACAEFKETILRHIDTVNRTAAHMSQTLNELLKSPT